MSSKTMFAALFDGNGMDVEALVLTVAAVCVEALFDKSASNRVVEIVASPDAPKTSPDTWFA